MIFQQTTTNSDMATNRFHDDAHISLKACFTHGLFRFIRHLFRRRMTHKDIDNSQILIVVTGSSVSFPIRLSPSTPDTSGAARQNTREVYTGCSTMDNCRCYLTRCDSEFVGVCWGSVNRPVIFNKTVIVCWCLSERCELAFMGL